MSWFKKSSLMVPASIKSRHYGRVYASKSFAQFGHARGDSSDSNNSVVVFISGLPLGSSPAHIGNVVAFFIVNSFKRPSRFALPHVSNEVLKCAPSLTHEPAVAVESVVIWVCASSLHSAPHLVNSGSAFTMLGPGLPHGFSAKTPTRPYPARPEVTVANYNFTTAVATAKTSSALVSERIGLCNHKKSCEPLSDDVYSGRHGIDNSNVLFSGGRQATTCDHRDYSTVQ